MEPTWCGHNKTLEDELRELRKYKSAVSDWFLYSSFYNKDYRRNEKKENHEPLLKNIWHEASVDLKEEYGNDGTEKWYW